jgi:hypothetical protein
MPELTRLTRSRAGDQSSGQKVQLSGRFKAYAETTAGLNAAAVSGHPFDAVSEFAKACIQEDTGKPLALMALFAHRHLLSVVVICNTSDHTAEGLSFFLSVQRVA